jgi:hypothetical protein
LGVREGKSNKKIFIEKPFAWEKEVTTMDRTGVVGTF